MYVTDRTVTPQFRQALAELLPGLSNNQGYWRMTSYLLFGTWRAEESGELMLPAPLVASMEGKQHNQHYCAWDFIQAYSTDVAPIHIRAHRFDQHRRVIGVEWPDGVEALAALEARVSGGERVYMSTGALYHRAYEVADRRKTQAQALETMSNAGCQPAWELLNYLNHLAPRRFTSIKKHLPQAHSLVEQMQWPDEKTARQQHNILKAIEDQAQPYYAPTERSVRIFSLNESLLRLQRDIRRVMTQDWITADLRSAQLAIVARAWPCPDVEEFLRAGKSIWKELCAAEGIEYTPENKQIYKDALYAVIFGAGNQRLHRHFNAHFDEGKRAWERFKAHPVIRALLLARFHQLKAIKQAGYAVDAFGQRIELRYFVVPGKLYSYDNARSLMALVAQSYEMLLLYPVLQLAQAAQDSTHGFTITSWLHDGLTFDVHDKRDSEMWKGRIAKAVQTQANALGIATVLEFS